MSLRLRVAAFLTLASVAFACAARGPTGPERRDILDAVRPLAAKKADQGVRIRVDTLNVDSDWAILMGDLVGLPGQPMVWDAERNCDPNYGHGLWAVLNRVDGDWQVRDLDICVVEPVFWDLSRYKGAVWPCGVYEGMFGSQGEDIEALCRTKAARSHRR